MPNISIDMDSCISCGACADICYARDVFEMGDDGPVVAHPEHCRSCGHCVAVCPTDSIDHDAAPVADCPIIVDGRLPSVESLVSAFRARRSVRRFQDRPVPRETIRELISHARWIPTGNNRQFIDWIALDDGDRIAELLRATLRELRRDVERGRDPSKYLGTCSVEDVDRLVETAVERKRQFFFNAPVVLAGYCERGAVCAREEATYAAYNIALAAERLDLGTCHIGSIHLLLEEFTRLQHELLGIPDGMELHTLLVLGYPARRFRRMVPRRMPEILWNPQ